MKKCLLFACLLVAIHYGNAQTSVYIKFTPYSGGTGLIDENPSTTHAGQIAVTTASNDEVQTLSIGSQSTGAGAGKVTFNPFVFSKPLSVNSPTIFGMMCSGTPFEFMEVSYYNTSDQIVFRQTFSLAAVKTMARTAASCASGCPGIIENISMEYGTEVLTYYRTPGNLGSAVNMGWNRVMNIQWNDPTKSIK